MKKVRGTFYDYIGVSNLATAEEIEAVCTSLGAALRGSSTPDSKRKFSQLEFIFEVLMDSQKRDFYDDFLRNDKSTGDDVSDRNLKKMLLHVPRASSAQSCDSGGSHQSIGTLQMHLVQPSTGNQSEGGCIERRRYIYALSGLKLKYWLASFVIGAIAARLGYVSYMNGREPTQGELLEVRHRIEKGEIFRSSELLGFGPALNKICGTGWDSCKPIWASENAIAWTLKTEEELEFDRRCDAKCKSDIEADKRYQDSIRTADDIKDEELQAEMQRRGTSVTKEDAGAVRRYAESMCAKNPKFYKDCDKYR